MYQSIYYKTLRTAILGLLLCSFVVAQDSWDRLTSLGPGTKIVVERSDGGRVKGKFTSATADALTIETGGRQIEIVKTELQSVYLTKRSSRFKRGLIGALAGAGAGVLIGVVAVTAAGADPLTPAGGFLYGLPVGAAIGAATGGSRKGELIYRR